MLQNNFIKIFVFVVAASIFYGCSNEYQIEPFDYKAEYDRVSKTKSSETKTQKEIDLTDIAQKKSNYR